MWVFARRAAASVGSLRESSNNNNEKNKRQNICKNWREFVTDKIICVHAEHTHSHSHTTYIYIYRGKRDTRMRCACARSGSLSCLFAISESDDPISYRQVCSIHVIVCYAAMRIWPGDGAFLWNVCFFYFSYYLIFILVVYIYIYRSAGKEVFSGWQEIYILQKPRTALCCVVLRCGDMHKWTEWHFGCVAEIISVADRKNMNQVSSK